MRTLVLLLFLILPSLVLNQTKETAVGRYAERGNLVSITNLTGLSECAAASVMGKVGKVKVAATSAHAMVRAGESEENIEIPLDRIKPDDRSAIFKQLVRKSSKVRIAGYRCKTEDAITAFSIDRIY